MFLGVKKYQITLLAVFVTFIFGFAVPQKKADVYPALEAPKLIFEGTPNQWDAKKVHTFSVVEANKDGFKYWAYYGLDYYTGTADQRKGGLARSNDLISWVKVAEPVIKSNCRWPTCVIDSKGIFNVFYAEYTPEIVSRIVRVTSKDGIHFGEAEEIVPFEKGMQNQNPFIYFNKNDKKYYLFYYHGRESGDSTDNHWDIMVKSAKDLNKIKDAKPKLIMSEKFTIAAPSIAFYNGKYNLLIEALNPAKWGLNWVTLAFTSSSIDKGYKEVSNNPVLKNDDACAFQYVLDKNLYITYSHRIDLKNNDWLLNIIKAKK
jgi:hypothetical protein